MTIPTGFDIGLKMLRAGADWVGAIVGTHRQQDITPSSARRSDGDTRYQLIPSESFWSQVDWAGGYGRMFPHDPTMFWKGPADTLEAGVLRPAWAADAITGLPAQVQINAVCTHSDGTIFVGLYDVVAAGWKLYSVSNNVATLRTALINQPYSLCAYRDGIWIGHGPVTATAKWAAGALTYPTGVPQGELLCQYASMLFVVASHAATQSFRINRFDPENPAAVADLAILPQYAQGQKVRSLVALGPDLFLVCIDGLYKFTSANGNSGTLVGPIDSWSVSGSDEYMTSGYASCAFQGALVYATGGTLRRHQPGGGSRQIWPVSPNVNNTDTNIFSADLAGRMHMIGDMVVVNDRLFLGMQTGWLGDVYQSTTAQRIPLYCWNGVGMHHLGDVKGTSATFAVGVRPFIAVDGYGAISLFGSWGNTVAAGMRHGRFPMQNPSGGRRRELVTEVYSSVLDFGMLDLDKVLAQIGVSGYMPDLDNYGIEVRLHTLLSTYAGYQVIKFEPTGNHSTRSDMRAIVDYVHFEHQIGRNYMIQLTLKDSASLDKTVEVYAVTAIPNPVYPVRYGFRVEIPVSTGVRLHDGSRAYANTTAVRAALNYYRGLRAGPEPIDLLWLDGASYHCRVNTIAVARTAGKLASAEEIDYGEGTAGGDEAWVVTLDLQEITRARSAVTLP